MLNLEDQLVALEAALTDYLHEIRGVPLSIEDIAARFIIYGSMLTQTHKLDDSTIMKLVSISRRAELSVDIVDGKKGN